MSVSGLSAESLSILVLSCLLSVSRLWGARGACWCCPAHIRNYRGAFATHAIRALRTRAIDAQRHATHRAHAASSPLSCVKVRPSRLSHARCRRPTAKNCTPRVRRSPRPALSAARHVLTDERRGPVWPGRQIHHRRLSAAAGPSQRHARTHTPHTHAHHDRENSTGAAPLPPGPRPESDVAPTPPPAPAAARKLTHPHRENIQVVCVCARVRVYAY